MGFMEAASVIDGRISTGAKSPLLHIGGTVTAMIGTTFTV
jgi:hypothetical protein